MTAKQPKFDGVYQVYKGKLEGLEIINRINLFLSHERKDLIPLLQAHFKPVAIVRERSTMIEGVLIQLNISKLIPIRQVEELMVEFCKQHKLNIIKE